jgi:hypothetical protein
VSDVCSGSDGRNSSSSIHRKHLRLQYCGGIVDGSIDIDVRAQIFRKLFLFASSTDCDARLVVGQNRLPDKHTQTE